MLDQKQSLARRCAMFAAAACLYGWTAAQATPDGEESGPSGLLYCFDASGVSDPAKPVPMKTGTNRNPKGEELGMNSFYFTRNGKPWFPVMGEIHYTRYPRDQWEDAILRMKAGGIEIIATYVFWIHHEEIQGQWEWTGNKDLRHFIQLCAKHGLYVWLRCGPYCHGECRNGGYPDWLLPKVAGPRATNPGLQKYARLLYQQIHKQAQGLLFKDGGPVIGMQLDNECGEADFLLWLKGMAREVGLDAPYYSETGWAGAELPPNEIIPVWGGYPDAPWTGGTQPLTPANQYTFTGTTANAAIGYELDKCRQILDKGFWLPPNVPFATAEMGTGNQIRYPRRPLFAKGDIDAMQYIVVGKGANLLGYYMYHGGSHPVGRVTTMEDTYDYPRISYDFLAALGEYGKPRPWYHSLRVLHMFLRDFGETLAPMFPVLPSRWQASPADTDTLRCCVRVNGDSGFLFFNNYHRGMPMKNLGPLQFQVKIRNEVLTLPQTQVVIKKDTYAIWPMNQPLGDAVLKYATAQPLCRLNVDGGIHYWFKTTDGVAPEYVFDSQTIASVECPEAKIARSGKWTTVGNVRAGTECVISLTTKNGRKIKISTLTSEQAEQCYKATIWGQERVFLSSAGLVFDGQRLQLLYCAKEKTDESANTMGLQMPNSKQEIVSFAVFPPVEAGLLTAEKRIRGSKDGIFERYQIALPRGEIPVKWEAVSDSELRRRENALSGAQWIWSGADNTSTATQYFRKEFTAPEGAQIRRATLVYSAANYLKLWIAGQLVDEGGSAAMVPPFLDVTGRVRAGRNVIAVAATSPLGFGGWIARLVLEFEDGKSQTIVTDPTWKSAKAEQNDWFAVAFDDGAWGGSAKIADLGGKPWTNVPENWYGPAGKAWRVLLPPQVTAGLSDVLLRINYAGDVAFLTESRSGRLLADNFYNQPLWEVGLKHFSPECLRGGVVLWITPLKKDAQIYMPEENRPKFNGVELSEVRNIEAIPEYRIVVTSLAAPK
jgi:hypothetical protein